MSSLGVSALDPERAAFGLGDKIHAEVESLVNEGLDRARRLLSEHRRLLESVCQDPATLPGRCDDESRR